MRFLLDESTELRVGRYFRSIGHDVTAIVRDYTRSISDRDVLALAVEESRVLVTNDKDFIFLVFNELRLHAGVILFRLGQGGGTLDAKISWLEYILAYHANDLDAFISVYPNSIAIRRTPIVEGDLL